MKKKDKKKLKKKDKFRMQAGRENQTDTQDLQQRIKHLEKELKQRDGIIETLNRQLKDRKARKGKKNSNKSALNALFAQQTSKVGVAQKKAWKRHGYLRDRYEFHLAKGKDITDARNLAGQDLREEFGDDAGYSEQELAHILS